MDKLILYTMQGQIKNQANKSELMNKPYIICHMVTSIDGIVDIEDTVLFGDFIRSATCRVGQVLNITDIAQDVGISNDTAKRWLKILEKSDVIFFLRPYSNNLLKRTVST